MDTLLTQAEEPTGPHLPEEQVSPPLAWTGLKGIPPGRTPLRKGLAGSKQRMKRPSHARVIVRVSTGVVWILPKDGIINCQS